ncbi:MAG: aldehyde dehydrogenase [Alphaproteobacteria bacterium]|nr:aldehyde dehydrogenase [Alphaproteobacteria bacterium]
MATITVRGQTFSTAHLIDGQRVDDAESTFPSHNPCHWGAAPLGAVPRGDAKVATLAVDAAVRAFPGWAAMSPAERREPMHRLAALIDASLDRIAAVEASDMAMRFESLKMRVIPRAARNFRVYADMAVAYEERVWHSNTTANRVLRMPAGPAVIITPWNAPFMLSSWKVAPALAAGNTVILKPAEWSPLSACLLAEMIVEAGFPPGVFNIVHGLGHEVGDALVTDPRVRRLSFTGSPATARKIGAAGAKNIVPFTAELGGKAPLIVFDDADIDMAAKKAAGQYDDSGQSCMANTRLLVHQSVRDEFLAHFYAYTAAHVLGDAFDDATTITPLIHGDHLDRVLGFVDRAIKSGDKLLLGGKRHREGQLWIEPTLIEPQSNESEIVQNEVFGPVLSIQTFADEAEAVALANSTRYGLSAVLYTSSAARAERVGRLVRAGTVWVNCYLIRDLTAPFGGTGISGLGREGGDFALDFHSDLKTLQILEDSVS